MEEKLMNLQNTLDRELEILDRTVGPYKEKISDVNYIMEDIRHIYGDKLKQMKPQIMVFGIYNAGKSSILNELMREDKAKVDDVPTTDHVEYYIWHGYSIADTPGVGAPIQHERVTNETIRKADVVLFVMSTNGSSEKKENYIRMKDITDAGKKVIIVLNDKNSDLINNPDAVFYIRQKVYDNMQAIGIDKVDDKFTIVTVNAQMAHDGRVKNKPVLWEKSNILELESVILSELKKTTNFDILRHAVYEISKDVDKLRTVLSAKDKSKEFTGLQEVLDSLRKGKKQVRNEMNHYITGQTTRLAESLPSKIWAVKDNQNEVDEVVRKSREDLIEKVRIHLKDQMQIIFEGIQSDLEQYSRNMKKLELAAADQINVGNVKNNDANTNNHTEQLVKNSAPDAIGSLSGALLEGELTSKAYRELAEQAGSLAKSLMEEAGIKIGKKSITEYALTQLGVKSLLTRIPIPFPPVEVLLVGYTILKSIFGDNGSYERACVRAEQKNAIEEQKIKAEQQVIQQLRQKCIYSADDLKDALIHWSNEVIWETIGKYEKHLDEQMKSIMNAEKESIDTAEALSRISDDYHRLAVDLETGTI